MARKLKPKISVKPASPVTATKFENDNTCLIISYKHLCLSNKKYSMDLVNDSKEKISYYDSLYKKLNEYSQHENFKKYVTNNHWYRNTNHIHLINWNDIKIKEACFSSLDKSLMDQVKNDCWQLGINQQFRIHGFFIENVFYIVWLDPLHNLYERK